ncbi:MAG: DUF4336 domain-containing protein [Xenococcaceae cyanobacterium MO_188.B29]|nr:DUF4336 domain-containing protein [Xenococcaceae cyanobacterium MO_188.B29]
MEVKQKQSKANLKEFNWKFWSLVPIYPYSQRRTIRQEVVENTIWTFEQLQGIFYVVVPIRMTVVKLESGGLLVYAPVAPTLECLRLVNELVAEHGDVKYIILPTISGLEHKVFVAPFARKFPQAQVFVAPNQWSFPINLPLSWLGLPAKRTHILPDDSSKTPFAQEFDYAILGPIDLKLGWFEEVVFYHKRSRSLLVTDSIVSIPEEPPAIVQLDPYPLLFHARDSAIEPIEDTPANRRKGWQRICLFAMYFRSSVLEVPQWRKVFLNAFRASDRSKKAYFGLFPFQWQEDWYKCFSALRGDGRLFVAPILQTLILNREPKATLKWVEQVASWNFQRILPCHMASPIKTEPIQFCQAFSFLQQYSASILYSLPEEDFQVLREIDKSLYKSRIVPPPKGKV